MVRQWVPTSTEVMIILIMIKEFTCMENKEDDSTKEDEADVEPLITLLSLPFYRSSSL